MDYKNSTTCGLQNEGSNEFYYRLNNRPLVVNWKYYCQQCKKVDLAAKKYHLEPDQHKNLKKSGIVKHVKEG